MFSLKDVSTGYAGKPVLRNISINIGRGQLFGLIGPNGSGKTTLLRVMSGVLPILQGEVRLKQCNLREMSRREVATIVAHLLQDVAIGLAFSVREMVLMGRSPHIPRFGARPNAISPSPTGRWNSPRSRILPTGRSRRSAAASVNWRVHCDVSPQEPQVLLLDEPTSHLDIGHQISLLNLLTALNRQSEMTIVAVFHDLNLAAEYCDRLVLLDRGTLTSVGPPRDVLTTDMLRNVYQAKVLVENNPISGRPHIVLAAGR